jgi:hypothetical protein
VEEVVREQAADLLGLLVVGVVVAGAKGVGAEHDAALDLGSEALVARLAVHGGEGAGVFRAIAVADTVEAGQVGAGLGGGEDVVGRHGVAGMGERDLLDLGAC